VVYIVPFAVGQSEPEAPGALVVVAADDDDPAGMDDAPAEEAVSKDDGQVVTVTTLGADAA